MSPWMDTSASASVPASAPRHSERNDHGGGSKTAQGETVVAAIPSESPFRAKWPRHSERNDHGGCSKTAPMGAPYSVAQSQTLQLATTKPGCSRALFVHSQEGSPHSLTLTGGIAPLTHTHRRDRPIHSPTQEGSPHSFTLTGGIAPLTLTGGIAPTQEGSPHSLSLPGGIAPFTHRHRRDRPTHSHSQEGSPHSLTDTGGIAPIYGLPQDSHAAAGFTQCSRRPVGYGPGFTHGHRSHPGRPQTVGNGPGKCQL
jgi:hypothetical protein